MNATKRQAANRANAALSTGPKTAAGKAKSSRNAVTTALTGRTVLLPADDIAVYEQHLRNYVRQFKPLTPYEHGLVQSLADTDWRLQRIPALLLALEAKGFADFAENSPHTDPAPHALSIAIDTRIHYEKHFRNLELQESRLSRRHDKELAELRAVQKERDRQRAVDLDVASKLYLAAEHDQTTFDPEDHGFDFSLDQVHCYLNGRRAALIAREALTAPANHPSPDLIPTRQPPI